MRKINKAAYIYAIQGVDLGGSFVIINLPTLTYIVSVKSRLLFAPTTTGNQHKLVGNSFLPTVNSHPERHSGTRKLEFSKLHVKD